MNEIRAFIGHSFIEDDAATVDKFLKYFDTVAKLHPAFSWEHAEAAEPKLLSEKVMSLIANKNTFIGICTRNELAVSAASLSNVYFQPAFRKANKSTLQWKASDWIIQEIGMAKARDLEIILLIEDEVRRPGGLQGDVEYIPFSRDAPEKSFNKILEMITALSPKPRGETASLPDVTSSASNEQQKSPTPTDDDWKKPVSTWQRTDYERAIFRMFATNDAEAADRLSQAYLATPEAKEGDNRDTWEARNEWLRILFGMGGKLGKLKALAAEHPSSAKLLEYLARALNQYDSHDAAAEQYEAAARVATDQADAMRLMGYAAVQHAKAGASKRTAEIVAELKSAVKAGTIDEMQTLITLRYLAEIAKQENVLIVIIERMIELTPDDVDMRFLLAYKHSQIGNSDLALANYLKTPYHERSRMAWNNLGVAYDNFRLRDKAVNAYQKAEEMGETLAMSNLANKLMNIGMTREARAKCDQALLIKDHHKNVADLLSRLMEIPEEEDKKLEELLERTKPKSEFYLSLGRAISLGTPSVLAERWEGPDCVLELHLSNGDLRISGTYELDANPLAAALGSFGLATLKVKHQVEYLLTLRGRAIDGVVKRTKDGKSLSAAASLLEMGDNGSKVLMVLSDDQTEFRVMESPHSVNPTFYSIRQLVSSG